MINELPKARRQWRKRMTSKGLNVNLSERMAFDAGWDAALRTKPSASLREPDGWITIYDSLQREVVLDKERADAQRAQGYRVRSFYFDAPGAAPAPDTPDLVRRIKEAIDDMGPDSNDADDFSGDGLYRLLNDVLGALAAPSSAATVFPEISVKCVTPDEIGSTFLTVKRIEIEDDNSFTAIVDHWPSSTAAEPWCRKCRHCGEDLQPLLKGGTCAVCGGRNP